MTIYIFKCSIFSRLITVQEIITPLLCKLHQQIYMTLHGKLRTNICKLTSVLRPSIFFKDTSCLDKSQGQAIA
jgi:hypothetical protein